jgi:NADH-quinone oxidoreductase subunit G
MGRKKVTITLNGEKVEAFDGERMVDVIKRHGYFLCAPCYHKYLSEIGHCKMCLVGARKNAENKFVVAYGCIIEAKEGIEVDTEYPEAVSMRNELFMLCLLKHPLDCSKCDKVGNCFLHKFSSQTKFRGFSRIVNGKLVGVEYKDFGNGIAFDERKCIGCKRCIRFCRDILDEEVLGFIRTCEGHKAVDLYPGKTLAGNYFLNLVDLCPAGAFIDKNCVHQPAEWELIHTESISTESSVGVNTYVLHKENKIFRIVPRENSHVNGAWIPDSARIEHKFFDDKKRLTKIMRMCVRSRMEASIAQIIKSILGQEIAIVCSGDMSLEDQFALRMFADRVVCSIFFLKKSRTADGFLISADATPNFNGAILTGLATDKSTVDDLKSMNKSVMEGKYKKILSINEEIFSHGVSYALPPDVEIFYVGTCDDKTAKRASVAIPTATIFERTGTFINRDWRLQKFHQAVNPPNKNIFPMWYVFSLLLNTYANFPENTMLWLDDVWKNMAKTITSLENVDFKKIKSKGVLIKKS